MSVYLLLPSQLLAGLSKPTSGSINIRGYNNDGKPNNSPEPLPPEKVGIVFQFPERYQKSTGHFRLHFLS